ncbi:MAG TPA: tetratricopeptide repeat protein [Verrucomicrobiae bacterium]|nr:tetratricopeptide repeat protein [Verrucomicrobiae bacterium]
MNDFETAKRFFVEGLQLLEANNPRAAEAQLTRSLELVPRASTLNNLSVIKVRLKQFVEAEEFARQAIALEEKSPEAWANLGNVLITLERYEEAVQACDQALQYDASFARAWLVKAKALLELKRYDEALVACDRALALDPEKHDILYTKSQILKGLEQLDEARKFYLKSFEVRVNSSPVVKRERRETQKGDVLIMMHDPHLEGVWETFEKLHFLCGNFPGQVSKRLQDDFHFNYVFVGNAARPSARPHISQPDFVINNVVNGQEIITEGSLPGLTALINSFGVPVVNHPTHVVQTIRDTAAKALEGAPGVLVPKTMRFSSVGKKVDELVHELEEHFDYPMITRALAAQRGVGMYKSDSREVLVAQLSTPTFPKEFFVTQFVDTRGESKFYRKIRAAVVRDDIIIIRSDYKADWKVHGRQKAANVPFYMANLYLLEEEKRVCLDFEATLGRPAMQALRAIRERVPLDIFGIDFDVCPDGRVIFYEANATMNLLMTAHKEVPNPKEAEDNLVQAFKRYFTSLMTRR